MSPEYASARRPLGRPEPMPQLRVVEFDAENHRSNELREFTSATQLLDSVENHTHKVSRLRTQSGRLLKRLFDLSLAIPIVLFVLPPLCVLVKLGQLLGSKGPLLYRQKRTGQDGQEFTIFKFRTMNVPPPGQTDLEENPGPRIYPFGEFMRRTKIDEIPQFINVLLGSMSVVGPRPHHFDDCIRFGQRVREYPLRLIAKPGITGLAQYKEYRGDFQWNCVVSRVAKDLNYIRDWSLALDLILVAKTVNIVVRRSLFTPSPQSLNTGSNNSNIQLNVFQAHSPEVQVGQFDTDSPERLAA